MGNILSGSGTANAKDRAAVYEAHRPKIAALVRRLVPNPGDWADAEQVGAVALLGALDGFERRSAFWTCAYLRVRGAVIDWATENRTWSKRNGHRDPAKTTVAPKIEISDAYVDAAVAHQPTPEEAFADAEIQEIVGDFVEGLTEDDRAAVTTTDMRRLRRAAVDERREELLDQVAALIKYGEP